jgi:hypothetical protein
MACYLVASMNSAAYNFKQSSVIAVVIAVLVFVLAEIMPVKQYVLKGTSK